jgi:hypothetical protein
MARMKNENRYYAAAAALCLAWFLTPSRMRAASHDFNISVDGNAEHCSDLRVRSSDGEIAQAADAVTLQKAEAPVLELDDAGGHGVVRVRGWNQATYSVETCRIAVAENRAAAEQLVRGIAVSHSAGRFSTSGPKSASGNWQVYFIVHAPQDGNLDLQTKNGPISVAEMAGTVKVRAVNGPVSLADCTGQVNANTTNGPISYSGSGGDVHLIAQNGPISLKLAGEVWNGPKLEARSDNGPISLNVPEVFRSGIRVETSGHAPLSCGADFCRNAWTDAGSDHRVLQLNGSQDTIRVSTDNGPVSVNGGRRGKRAL